MARRRGALSASTTPDGHHLDSRRPEPDNRAIVFVPLALVLLFAAHIFDLLSFIVMTDLHGLEAEANPIVVFLAQELGLLGLTLVKFGAVGFGGLVFALLIRHRRRVAAAVVVYGIAVGMVGGFSNVLTIYA